VLFLGACGDDGTPEILIYTSIYPEVIATIEPELEARFPGVRFRWYQKGSEQVAVRLNAELEAGGTDCDLLLTSDPFYYAQLRDAGQLLAHETDATRHVPEGLKDPRHHFATVRIPVMVLGVGGAGGAASFHDLTDVSLTGRVTMGDPLKSGTNFTTVAALSRKYGWTFFEALRRQDLMAAGGNSAVLRRLESGERTVGVILLENLLSAMPEDAGASYPIEIVFPADGAIPIPSPIAILRHTAEPELARQVFDAFFSAEIQAAIVQGDMYSPLPSQAPPDGAPPLDELELFPWSNEFVEDVRSRRTEIKQRWREVMR
jgi:iron(III) transport system substrate-binding protein